MHVFQAPAAVHELDGQPVQQFRVRWRLALFSQILRSTDQPDTEIGLPDPVHQGAGAGGRIAIHQPLGESETRWRRRFQQGMKKGGHARTDRLTWLEKIAPRQDMRVAWLLAGLERELRGPFGMLLPQLFDLGISLLPLGNGCSPVAKHRLDLRRRALIRWDGEKVPHILRQRVGDRVRRGGDG